MPRAWLLLVWTAAWLLPWTPAAAASMHCATQPHVATVPVEVVVPRSHWLLVRLREDGSDWVLMAKRDGWHLQTDTAPSRLAIEHLTLPGRLFPTLEIDARTWSGDGLSKPEVEFSCVPWNASLAASMDLMWGGAWLVEFESAGGASAAARLDQQARAHFARVLNDASEPGLQATAQHSVAYLMTRVGHRAAAAVAFDQAAQWWQLAGHRGADLAARFHAAQARLNSGKVAEAMVALDALHEVRDLPQWPFLQRWIDNDRCVAQHDLGEWNRAAACFAAQAQQFQAEGLVRDSALARCNRLAALAGGRRWHEAEAATSDCISHQFASGSARGRAQALHLRGWVRLQNGQLSGGIDDLAAALSLLQSTGDDATYWQVRSLLADAWLVLDEEPRAVAMLQAGLAEFPRERDPATHARLLHQLARAQRWNRESEAVATLVSARDEYTELGWTRQAQAASCELATAGAEPAPVECPLGAARGELQSGANRAMLQRVLAAALAADDWPTRILWLELAVDAARAGADPGAIEPVIGQLIDRSRTLDSRTELTRRIRAAVQLELAGAAAALAADTGIESLAGVALELARNAGPPLSSARSVLFGITDFAPDRSDAATPAASASPASAALPTGIAELSYLRFGDHSYWLIARGDQIHALRAPGAQITRELGIAWRQAIDQQADPAQLRAIAASIAEHLSIDELLSADDRILLTRFNGPVAELPWPALPRDSGAVIARLGYAPLGATSAVIAVSGAIDESSLAQPIAIGQLAAVNPQDLPIELAGSRSESAYLQHLGTEHQLPLRLLSLAELSASPVEFQATELFLLSGHAAADRAAGDGTSLRLGVDGSRRWGTVDLEAWRHPPAMLILGACESAAGPERRYFGDFGLASAAARSGSPWVLGHRWPVDDQAAAELHRAFIEALLSGASPSASLVRAQLALATSRRFSSPRHWAGALLIHAH